MIIQFHVHISPQKLMIIYYVKIVKKKVSTKFQIISMNICKTCYKIKKKQYQWYINNEGNPNDISKILPNLYLGGRDAAICEDELLKIGITNIMCADIS